MLYTRSVPLEDRTGKPDLVTTRNVDNEKEQVLPLPVLAQKTAKMNISPLPPGAILRKRPFEKEDEKEDEVILKFKKHQGYTFFFSALEKLIEIIPNYDGMQRSQYKPNWYLASNLRGQRCISRMPFERQEKIRETQEIIRETQEQLPHSASSNGTRLGQAPLFNKFIQSSTLY